MSISYLPSYLVSPSFALEAPVCEGCIKAVSTKVGCFYNLSSCRGTNILFYEKIGFSTCPEILVALAV
jgi:hypothetical protein